jgi:predicted GIY-YIG superfamily endonuclease
MTQMLLFPDPRPLVERLGPEFFRQAPEGPGVYLMRDTADTVLYVGKAKNLRKRLASYRVANPERLRRRQLKLLRAVSRIELQECPTESSALAREASLLRGLRPRFNRVGTWPGPARFFSWKATERGLELAVNQSIEPGWHGYGPLGAVAIHLRATLVRLLWCALSPKRGLGAMPEGWFGGRLPSIATIPRLDTSPADFDEAGARLQTLFAGRADGFADWVRERTSTQSHPFESAVREADLEAIIKFASRLAVWEEPELPPDGAMAL